MQGDAEYLLLAYTTFWSHAQHSAVHTINPSQQQRLTWGGQCAGRKGPRMLEFMNTKYVYREASRLVCASKQNHCSLWRTVPQHDTPHCRTFGLQILCPSAGPQTSFSTQPKVPQSKHLRPQNNDLTRSGCSKENAVGYMIPRMSTASKMQSYGGKHALIGMEFVVSVGRQVRQHLRHAWCWILHRSSHNLMVSLHKNCKCTEGALQQLSCLLHDDDVVAAVSRAHAVLHEEPQVVDVLCM